MQAKRTSNTISERATWEVLCKQNEQRQGNERCYQRDDGGKEAKSVGTEGKYEKFGCPCK